MFYTLFTIAALIKSITSEYIPCHELLLNIDTVPTQRMMGGWNPGYDAPTEQVKEIMTHKLPKEIMTGYGVQNQDYKIVDTWKKAIQQPLVLVTLKYATLDTPVCLLYRVLSNNYNLIIQMEETKQRSQTAPVPNQETQLKQVPCAQQYIGTTQEKALGGWKHRQSLQSKMLAKDLVNQKLDAIEDETYKFTSYEIVDLWTKTVSGAEILAELNTQENTKHICVMLYSQPWTNTLTLKEASIAKTVEQSPVAPSKVVINNMMFPCSQILLGVNKQTYQQQAGSWRPNESQSAITTARNAIDAHAEEIEQKTYYFEREGYEIVDLWTQVVSGMNMVAEIRAHDGMNKNHICVQLYVQQWTHTSKVVKAFIA